MKSRKHAVKIDELYELMEDLISSNPNVEVSVPWKEIDMIPGYYNIMPDSVNESLKKFKVYKCEVIYNDNQNTMQSDDTLYKN